MCCVISSRPHPCLPLTSISLIYPLHVTEAPPTSRVGSLSSLKALPPSRSLPKDTPAIWFSRRLDVPASHFRAIPPLPQHWRARARKLFPSADDFVFEILPPGRKVLAVQSRWTVAEFKLSLHVQYAFFLFLWKCLNESIEIDISIASPFHRFFCFVFVWFHFLSFLNF